jgi:predicted nucleic acid-binding Zn ribbon protein
MARCPHCGETIAEGQETCYACGQHVRTRAYRAEHRANPIVIIAACLTVVVVLGGLLLIRAKAARTRVALLAEEETLRAQDSARRAAHDWQNALRVAQNDDEARALAVELDDIGARFKSVCLRVASHPSPHQDSIIGQVEAELEMLRHSVVVLASSPEAEKQTVRDSIQAGRRRIEDLTKELGSTE